MKIWRKSTSGVRSDASKGSKMEGSLTSSRKRRESSMPEHCKQRKTGKETVWRQLHFISLQIPVAKPRWHSVSINFRTSQVDGKTLVSDRSGMCRSWGWRQRRNDNKGRCHRREVGPQRCWVGGTSFRDHQPPTTFRKRMGPLSVTSRLPGFILIWRWGRVQKAWIKNKS